MLVVLPIVEFVDRFETEVVHEIPHLERHDDGLIRGHVAKRPAVEQSSSRRLGAEEDVLRHCHLRDERKFLKDRRNTHAPRLVHGLDLDGFAT